MKTKTLIIAILFMFIAGLEVSQAASNDCLLDVFQAELKEKNSDKLYDYFLNKPEEDCNRAYNAWQVLYKADKNADRFDTAKLDELSAYLDRTDNDLDEVVNQISNSGSYEHFKRTVYWKLHSKDTSKKLIVKDGVLTIKDCANCAPLAKTDITNGQLNLDEITQWLPLEISSVNKVGKLEDVNYYQDRLSMTGDIDIVEDISTGKLYLSDGNEQLVQKALLNADFKGYYKRLSDQLGKDWRSDFLGLSEEAMIDYYAGNTYARFNSALIQKSQADDILALEQLFNKMLDKIESSPGTYYRGIGKTELNKILQSKVGDEILYDNFLSTSASKKTAASFAANNVIETGEGAIVEVISKEGKYFSDPSESSGVSELEVLHKSKSVFIIDKIEYVNGRKFDEVETALDGYYRIVVREKGLAKSISSNGSDTWLNSLPTDLRAQLFKNKDEMYDLFKSADPTQREKLTKSWEVLKNAAGLYYQAPMVIKLSTIGDKFHYNGIKGFDALKPLFTTYTTDYPDLKLLTKEMDFINKLSELESLFMSTSDLPVSFTAVRNSEHFNPVALDGLGDVIIKAEGGNIVKNKFFDKTDASYEKVGEYNGFDILRKGDEIGFKSADVININREK